VARRGSRSAAHLSQAPLSAEPRICDAPGCLEAGEFRAPRSRHALTDYLWFCLTHVREYNAAWDFYRGMSADEIEGHLRQDTAWQRPTWPLGRLGGPFQFDPETLRDPLGTLRGTPLHEARRRRPEALDRNGAQPGVPAPPPPELRASLEVLGLSWPVDQPGLRARYKELAKRLHPDANGGDRDAEEQLKDVNRAYSLLRARLGAANRRHRAEQPEPASA
jgi:hypothetical protein